MKRGIFFAANHNMALTFTMRITAAAIVMALYFAIGANPAAADLKLCNNTGNKVGVALGYNDTKQWVSEGWWNINPDSCATLLKGDLIARYYYIYAVDYDDAGSWGGKSPLCTQDKLFVIPGHANCEDRGFKKTGFREIDTHEEADWTISLTDAGQDQTTGTNK